MGIIFSFHDYSKDTVKETTTVQMYMIMIGSNVWPLTCSEAVVVSMVVTTALLVKSLRAIVKNTEATDREAITMLKVEIV